MERMDTNHKVRGGSFDKVSYENLDMNVLQFLKGTPRELFEKVQFKHELETVHFKWTLLETVQ